MSAQPYNLPPRNPSLVPSFVRALPEQGAGKLALFDADGTLWRDDVADDFARFMIDSGHVTADVSWGEYLRIYRDDHAVGCEFMLRFYTGMARSFMVEQARGWWATHAKRRWVPEVLESLYLLAERGYTLWVVTGSPTETMVPLLDFLPVHAIVGMDFELTEGGVITGALTGIRCADGGKADKVLSLAGGRPVLFAAGNGTLDTAMIELAEGVRWSVYPNAAFHALSKDKGWHILERPSDFLEEQKLA